MRDDEFDREQYEIDNAIDDARSDPHAGEDPPDEWEQPEGWLPPYDIVPSSAISTSDEEPF